MTGSHSLRAALVVVVSLICEPAHAAAQDSLWQTYFDAATKARQQNRLEEAEVLFRAALKQSEQFAAQDARVAISRLGMGAIYRDEKKEEAAKPFLAQPKPVTTQAIGPELRSVAADLQALAFIYHIRGRDTWNQAKIKLKGQALHDAKNSTVEDYGIAETCYALTLQIRQRSQYPETNEAGLTSSYLGLLYYNWARYGDAVAPLKKAIQILEQQTKSEAQLAQSSGRYVMFKSTTSVESQKSDLQDSNPANVNRWLGWTYRVLAIQAGQVHKPQEADADFKNAEKYLRKALAYEDAKSQGPTKAELAQVVKGHAALKASGSSGSSSEGQAH